MCRDWPRPRRSASFDERARRRAAPFWPGPLSLVLPRRPQRRVAAGQRRARHGRGAGRRRIRWRRRCCAPRPADRGAFGQPLRPGQPDHRGACRRRTRRPGRADPRRRAVPGRHRIDRARPDRRRAGAVAAGRRAARQRWRRLSRRWRPAGRPSRASPGQLPSPLRAAAAAAPRSDARTAGRGVACLRAEPPPASPRCVSVRTGDLAEAAANLFAMLRRLDRPDCSGIAVMPIPGGPRPRHQRPPAPRGRAAATLMALARDQRHRTEPGARSISSSPRLARKGGHAVQRSSGHGALCSSNGATAVADQAALVLDQRNQEVAAILEHARRDEQPMVSRAGDTGLVGEESVEPAMRSWSRSSGSTACATSSPATP